MDEKRCIHCGELIDMQDYRSYWLIQVEDETARRIYVHVSCIDNDTMDPVLRLLEDC